MSKSIRPDGSASQKGRKPIVDKSVYRNNVLASLRATKIVASKPALPAGTTQANNAKISD